MSKIMISDQRLSVSSATSGSMVVTTSSADLVEQRWFKNSTDLTLDLI